MQYNSLFEKPHSRAPQQGKLTFLSRDLDYPKKSDVPEEGEKKKLVHKIHLFPFLCRSQGLGSCFKAATLPILFSQLKTLIKNNITFPLLSLYQEF